jgi:hypothetical protein
MTENIQINALLDSLTNQRNAALNQLAKVEADLAVANATIADLKKAATVKTDTKMEAKAA